MSGRTRRAAVGAAALTAAATGSALAADGPQTVAGRAFATVAPAGWRTAVVPGPRSLKSYQQASHGKVDGLGVPVKGAIATTIYEASIRKAGFARPEKQTADTLAPKLIGIPRGATKVKAVAGGHGILDGERTVYGTYTYTYEGRRIRQRDLVVRHGAYSVVLETIADTSRRAAADRARSTVQDAWHWR